MYYLKALDQYDYCLEMVIENLNYALAYDEYHVQAHALMGKVYMYHLKDYRLAQECFTRVLQSNIRYVDVYEHYILLKIWLGDYSGAERIMVFAKKIKGMNTSKILFLQARMLEARGLYKEALLSLELALMNCFNSYEVSEIECKVKSLKVKMKLHKKQRKRMEKKSKLNVE